MSLQGYYQNGYVTHDIERAIDLVSSQFGLGEFSRFDMQFPLVTPAGPKTVDLRVATAWVGKLQVELIEPVSGYTDYYLPSLPADRSDATPRFHHAAVRRDSEDDMRREAERLGLPVLYETGGAGITCLFVDTRAHLGHLLELVSASPETWDMLGWPRD